MTFDVGSAPDANGFRRTHDREIVTLSCSTVIAPPVTLTRSMTCPSRVVVRDPVWVVRSDSVRPAPRHPVLLIVRSGTPPVADGSGAGVQLDPSHVGLVVADGSGVGWVVTDGSGITVVVVVVDEVLPEGSD
jgi:hypothetical protein